MPGSRMTGRGGGAFTFPAYGAAMPISCRHAQTVRDVGGSGVGASGSCPTNSNQRARVFSVEGSLCTRPSPGGCSAILNRSLQSRSVPPSSLLELS
jgi:hypothetical protein